MNIFIFLLGVVLGAGVVWIITRIKAKQLKLDLKRTEKEEEALRLCSGQALRHGSGQEENVASGIADFNRQLQEMKEERKQRILKELEKRGPSSSAQGGLRRASKIKTNQVADLLEVSRATAFRYLEELEKQGKIEQIGAFGRNVRYRLKN